MDEVQPGIDQRLPTLAEREELAALCPQLEASLVPAPKSEIRRMIAKLSFGFPNTSKGSADEIEARLEMFALALADVPADVLGSACVEAVKSHTFMPAPAELRKLCRGLALRQWRLQRIKHLIALHDAQAPQPEDESELSPEQRQKIDNWLKSHGLSGHTP